MNALLRKLGIDLPLIQAPMAGVSTPEMAAAVSNAGGLGSLGVGSVDAEATRKMIVAVRSRTDRPFNVNVFCNQPAVADAAREAAWLARLGPTFARFGANPPARLTEIYQTFLTDDAKLAVLLAERPAVVSFHFGLPSRDRIEALRAARIKLLATATSLEEGKAVAAAGLDAVVAQGYEAGGHRGVFDPAGPDDRLGTVALTRLLVKALDVPVVAAGGIMDGAGIAACLTLGAAAAQLGTAFVACPESSADAGYRAALLGPSAEHTVMTAAISGRPARCLANRFTSLGEDVRRGEVPDYPIAYDAGKALHAAAKAAGEFGYGARWAGQGAPLARSLPAAELVARLWSETQEALSRRLPG
ncbi:NAD(P)H-dependent flavin oxidoreductase [Fimbriiglobus ruber]|uniref:Nitronate monooxygenase n=1 Tax=Fimbriiglobus ruber TaxID=1908690 RepID=A0A225EAY2_9BACT|nr:nitronate monooxygenase [Fimbriiglobus ruber]OWK45705.1 Enoyl-[acyl-carrier-protein] reductase [FMN] [Fimbriiglobus ruber]